ncbi:MAG: PAS domain S-box protein [Deltaproteobacteria bacterium]
MSIIYVTALSFIAAAASILLALYGVASGDTGAALPLCALSLLLLTASAFVIIRKVLSPIKKINDALERTSAGDYRDGAGISSNDSFGTLADHLNRLINSLNESVAHCRELVRTMPDLVIDIDRSGDITYMNEAATRLTGYTEEDVLNRPYAGFVDKRSSDEAEKAFKKVLNGESVRNLELSLILKNGGVNLFEFNAVPIWRAGAPAVCRAVGRDIEERKEIMGELKKARTEAEESSEKLKKTVRDLEDFALLAVRREIKMQEIREMLQELRKDMGMKKRIAAAPGRESARDIYGP